jgi:hypothetical protein
MCRPTNLMKIATDDTPNEKEEEEEEEGIDWVLDSTVTKEKKLKFRELAFLQAAYTIYVRYTLIYLLT